MKKVLLINPNSSVDTLDMMVKIAQGHAGDDFKVVGEAAQGVPRLLTTDEHQALAAIEVKRIAIEAANSKKVDGIIIAAYSDPGLEDVQKEIDIPVTGIGYASMKEACSQTPPQNFVIVTTTASLVDNLNRKVKSHGFDPHFLGVKLPTGDLPKIMSEPTLLKQALKETCEAAFNNEGAGAAIIGGGPFAEIAAEICKELNRPVIAPIKSAVCHMKSLLN